MERRRVYFIISVITVICFLILVLGPTLLSGPDHVETSLTLRVGAYENAPKIYTDNGKVIGFFPELLEYIASKEGWKIEYKHGTWTQCLERLENNEIDILVDVAYTIERATKYDFTNVDVITNWGIVYKSLGSKIETLSELEGKKVAVMNGSIHTVGENGIKNLTQRLGINCTFIEMTNYYQVFQILSDGGVDVGTVNRLFGMFNEDDYDVEKTSIIFNPLGLRFAFPKNAELNKELITAIDHHLLELMKNSNSIYYDLLDSYIFFEVQEFDTPEWIMNILIALLGLIILFFSTSALLERKVRSKTHELQKAHDGLEKKVTERTKELHKANIRLKELDLLKSMFLASMSHELRTPLNSIIGFTGWLLMRMEGELNEEQTKQLTMVKTNANHLLDLINDILDISKIEAGKLDLNLEEFDIAEVVNEVVTSVLPLVEDKKLQLIHYIPKGVILNSDRRRVKQVLTNLVSNAIKFTYEGNIKIEGFMVNKTGLQVTITDSGIGIKEEDIEILFQPFQQIDMSSTKKHEGTGLGLYLCKKILDLLSGDISVKSQFGKGSIFKILLPIKEKDE